MYYVMTCNEDRGTSSDTVMWTLHTSQQVTVYLNFRSTQHVEETGATEWLSSLGWESSEMRSTVSTGRPNGPYSGPVYFKSCIGDVELMGSNCSEGTYFVFLEGCAN